MLAHPLGPWPRLHAGLFLSCRASWPVKLSAGLLSEARARGLPFTTPASGVRATRPSGGQRGVYGLDEQMFGAKQQVLRGGQGVRRRFANERRVNQGQ
jgi:hypothetical protein